jgi:hypothetical protein
VDRAGTACHIQGVPAQRTEGVMSTYLLIMAIGAVVVLVLWRWDERAHRAELDRKRRFRLTQTSSGEPTPSRSIPASSPTAAGQRLG